jgi:hypothetical protein
MVVVVTLEIYEDSKFGVPEVKGRNGSQKERGKGLPSLITWR